MGPIVRRHTRHAPPVASTMLARINAGRLSPAPPPQRPSGIATPVTIGHDLPDWSSPEWVRRLSPARGPLGPLGSHATPAAATAVRTAAVELFRSLSATGTEPTAVIPIDLPSASAAVVSAIDPQLTIVESIRRRLRIAPGLKWQPADPLEPIMAAPEFPQPMSQPLAELSQEWLLPGLHAVPPNTVSLVQTNGPFIEAFMVGLNHEFARELLWNEYPTDQRGSSFRQFWNVTGSLGGTSTDPDARKDIKPIHAWLKHSALGTHSPRPSVVAEPLVLLVRGDLLRRYPNLIVYAVKAVVDTNGRRDLGTEERHPLFTGRLEPDVGFYGFDLEVSEARGGAGTQGWYFVLQEQPSEPRFGLDEADPPAATLTAWNNLSWGHLAADASGLAQITYIDLNASLPDTSAVTVPAGEPQVAWHDSSGSGPAGSKASDLAYITFQRPVRVAVHGSRMLP
jgi:hypothetical protein